MLENEVLKKCPNCGEVMIKRSRQYMLLTYPPQYPWDWWCGGCDIYVEGGTERGRTAEELYMEKWKQAQNKKED